MSKFDEIVTMLDDGRKQVDIAEILQCSEAYVSQVKKNIQFIRSIGMIIDLFIRESPNLSDVSEEEYAALDQLDQLRKQLGGT